MTLTRSFDVIADRFVVGHLAGRGGMGSVYRATDRLTGDTVALKVVERAGTGVTEERFRREAKALAAISHPAVARYVAEGATPRLLWLAMEWLEGEDLQARIDREPIPAAEGISLAARVAEGIAEAHRVGVVHRDLKPSNLLLIGGDVRAVKIIDFGVARVSERARPLTRTGQMIGTVGFMAPEQIHGERDVDERADVFALGALVFEVLTGRPAFPGSSLIAIIAKVLREEPPPIGSIGPPVPEALESLVASMLAKSRDARPSSMAMVAARLRELERTMGVSIARPVHRVAASVTGREQRLVSVLFVVPLGLDTHPPTVVDEEALGDEPTANAVPFLEGETVLDDATEASGAPGPDASTRPRLLLGDAVFAAAEEANADAISVGDGAWLIVVSAGGTAKDQAARAAMSALALRARGDCRVVVGTGLAEPTGGLPVGPAIDRAAQLVEAGELGGVAVDEVTAALVEDGFHIDRSGSPALLLAQGEAATSRRPARATPFVGRDKELAMIDAMMSEALDEPVARVVVVTGPPGAGKSRLRIECLRRAETRPSLTAIVARAHQIGAGAALGFVRAIVEQMLVLPEGSAEGRGAALEAALAPEFAPGAERVRARAFLGELLGCPPSDPPAELVAARAEPRALAERLKTAFVELVQRFAADRPLLVILEDLHWGDDASVEFLADALRRARDLPVFVLALARPEVWDALPRLSEALAPQEIKLGGLTPKAAQRLVEAALGKRATPGIVADLVARGEGNPFFLEELARGVNETEDPNAKGVRTSETVLAVVQSRVQRLEPEARRLLRAASVFGREFTAEGVARMLGLEATSEDLESILLHVEERDLVERTTRARGFRFSHDLLRDAVYAMIPDVERPSAHLVAAEWLASTAADPLVLAEQFERAAEPGRAVPYLLHAVENAENGASYERVRRLVERAVADGARGDVLGALEIHRAFACAWLHDWRGCQAAAADALALLPRGSTPWFRAAAAYTFACISLGDGAAIGALSRSLLEDAHRAAPTGAFAFAAQATLLVLSLVGRLAEARAIVEVLDAHGDAPSLEPAFVAWRALAHAHLDLSIFGRPGRARRWLAVSAHLLPSLVDGVARVVQEYFSAVAAYETGALDEAMTRARRIIDLPTTESVPYLTSWSHNVLGRSLLDEGRIADAKNVAERMSSTEDALVHQRALGLVAKIRFAEGDGDGAANAAETILAGTFASQDFALAHAVLARIALDRGDLARARVHVDAGVAVAEGYGSPASTRAALGVVRVRLLRAEGDEASAVAVLHTERARVDVVLSEIDDPAVRAALVATPEHAALLALAAR